MRKTRTIVALTLLATALCADRAVASTVQPAQADAAKPAARSFAQRLGVSLRRVVPAARLHQNRQEALIVLRVPAAARAPRAIMHRHEGTPFQFRLPPPLI